MAEVLIAGGGLAGLSAGIHLLEASKGQLSVRILERSHVIGGKASSMPHKDGASGRTYTVDHGFHVLFEYPNLLPRLRSLGALGGFSRVHHDALLWSDGKIHRLASMPLPSPLHVLAGGVASAIYGPIDGFALYRFLVEALLVDIDRLSESELAELDAISFDDWAASRGVPEVVRKGSFFRFVAQAVFVHPMPISALAAIATMQLVLASHRSMSIRYFERGASESVIDPLRQHFLRLGGVLERFVRVAKIRVDGVRVKAFAVEPPPDFIHAAEMASKVYSNYHSVDPCDSEPTDDAKLKDRTADHYVSALAPRDLERTLDDATLARPYFAAVKKLSTQRTIAFTVWLDRMVTPPDVDGAVVGLPGPFSTVADLARIQRDPEGSGSILQFVGEEGDWGDRTDDQLMAAALDEATALWPDLARATERKRYFHRGRHDAFFLATPGSDRLRPAATSPLSNLVLAGDFTQTGLRVLCMEGAWVSGMRAANVILERAGFRPVPIAPVPDPGGFVGSWRRLRRGVDDVGALLRGIGILPASP